MDTHHRRCQVVPTERAAASNEGDADTQQDVRSFKQAPKAKGKKATQGGLF